MDTLCCPRPPSLCSPSAHPVKGTGGPRSSQPTDECLVPHNLLVLICFSCSPEDPAPIGPSVEMVSLIRLVGVSEGSGMARGEVDQTESSDEQGTEVVLNSAILNKTPCPFLELLAFNH